MIEKALVGNRYYWLWISFLIGLIVIGLFSFNNQLQFGLGVTGMSRDVSWGLYIAQFTFLVGVAASAVVLVLPYYLHDYKQFGGIIILGEFLAVSTVLMCLLFIVADMGKPSRLFNVLLYPNTSSILFWDMIVLNGYLIINMVCGWVMLETEKNETTPPKWVYYLIYLSIPWAISIHTVTAFLYAGLPGRHLWLTAILAPRFLASAFAAGPSLLILLSILLKRISGFDVGKEAVQKLVTIVIYASIANYFFICMEIFTAFYSNIPEYRHSMIYLYFGLDGNDALVPYMRGSFLVGVGSVLVLMNKRVRANSLYVAGACFAVFASLLVDKGFGFIIGGFIPSPLNSVTEYSITATEVFITLGIWAFGSLVLTLLYKTAISIKLNVMN